MREITGYIRDYFRSVNKNLLIFCTVQTATLIYLNYHFHLESWLTRNNALVWPSFTGHFILFATTFTLPYLLISVIEENKMFSSKPFIFLLVVAPAIFSLKMSLYTALPFSPSAGWNEYWNRIYYWPVRLLVVISLLFLVWRLVSSDQPFYGIAVKKIRWKPYVIMLVCMLPLIAAASTQKDFLSMYPKIKSVLHLTGSIHLSWFHKMLFELSYGSDFFGIEFFFRGFLVLGFIRWAGKDAILPMACFYCTIHFGKPLGECISSYLGGLLLGIVVQNTRSVYGGLAVHLGIAWLMEIGGYVGNAMT